MKKIAIFLLYAAFLLSACTEPSQHISFGGGNYAPKTGESSFLHRAEAADSHNYYTVFIGEINPMRVMHETGAPMLGLLSEFNSAEVRTVAQEERLLEVSHDAIVHVMRLDDDFPKLWFLEMLAEQKLPVIIIEPPETTPFDHALLEEVVPQFGQFPIPMLVAFYPVTRNTNWDTDEYLAFFRYARILFNQYAPQAAFVWQVDAAKENFMVYYPGERAVDWVGVCAYVYEEDLWEQIAEIYHTFQGRTPIMLNLGISHISAATHRYRITEAAQKLRETYESIAKNMPRIRLVNYTNINRLREGGHDFRVCIDAALRDAYREAAALLLQNSEEETARLRRSEYTAVEENGRVYLDLRIVTEELNLPMPPEVRFRAGEKRVDAALLEGFRVCHENRQVIFVGNL